MSEQVLPGHLVHLPSEFAQLRGHLIDRADHDGLEMLWDALEAVRVKLHQGSSE